MKDLENKKILGVPLGTVVVILGIGIAVYIVTGMWGSKILGWFRGIKNPFTKFGV